MNQELRLAGIGVAAAVHQGDGWRVSFNPDTSAGVFGESDGGPETALVRENAMCCKDGHIWTGDQFFILKGDWREEYAALIDAGETFWTLKIQVYDINKKAHGARHSSDFHEWGIDGVPKPPTRRNPSSARNDRKD